MISCIFFSSVSVRSVIVPPEYMTEYSLMLAEIYAMLVVIISMINMSYLLHRFKHLQRFMTLHKTSH